MMQCKITVSLADTETIEPCMDVLFSSLLPCFYAVQFGECFIFLWWGNLARVYVCVHSTLYFVTADSTVNTFALTHACIHVLENSFIVVLFQSAGVNLTNTDVI